MALISELEIQAGFTKPDAYWTIGSFYWNRPSYNVIEIRLDGYASQAAYAQGLPAILSKLVQIEFDLNDLEDSKTKIFNQLRSVCYDFAKSLPDFINSVDA